MVGGRGLQRQVNTWRQLRIPPSVPCPRATEATGEDAPSLPEWWFAMGSVGSCLDGHGSDGAHPPQQQHAPMPLPRFVPQAMHPTGGNAGPLALAGGRFPT